MAISIRRARVEDSAAIHQVIRAVHPLQVPEDMDGGRGFLMGLHSAETYARRIAESDLIFVAEEENSGEGLAGFLAAYRASVCAKWYEAESAYGVGLREGGAETVLLDQIGVSPAFKKRGVATLLYEAFAAACGERPVVLDIVHAPVANRASQRFFVEQRGYKLLREYAERGLVYGLYKADRA